MSQPTPHEDHLDYTEDAAHKKSQCNGKITKSHGPPSPPTSPTNVRISAEQDEESYADPPLYQSGTKSAHSIPLFPVGTDEEEDTQVIQISSSPNDGTRRQGLSTRKCNDINTTSPTLRLTKEDYMSAASLVSILHSQNPRSLYKQTMEENERYFAMARHVRPTRIGETKPKQGLTISIIPEQLPNEKLKKPTPRRDNTKPNRVSKPVSRRRTGTPSRATPPGSVKTPTAKKEPERRFWLFEDVCPAISTLGTKDDVFDFVKWGDGKIDLSEDPNRHLLHPAELKAAEALRLPCDRWLVTKRLIFLSVLECHRIGKTFKKTDAQKAGVIDVNKSSKIWEAFDSVGWFDAKHFRDF